MSKKQTKTEPTKKADPRPREREAVLEDFRRIAGPLRGRNRDQKPKA